MKTKILNALKTEYAKLGLGDKAFDGVASFLEKTITNENDIITKIKGDDVVALLRGIQGDADVLRSAQIKAEKDFEEYKKAHPDTTTTTTTTTSQDDEFRKELQALKDKQAEYERKISEAEGKAKRDAILTSLDRLLKDKGCDNDFIRKTTLVGVAIGENDTAETLLDTYKGKYDENFKEAYGNGAVPPAGNQTPVEYQKGGYASEVERLRAEGKLPAAK